MTLVISHTPGKRGACDENFFLDNRRAWSAAGPSNLVAEMCIPPVSGAQSIEGAGRRRRWLLRRLDRAGQAPSENTDHGDAECCASAILRPVRRHRFIDPLFERRHPGAVLRPVLHLLGPALRLLQPNDRWNLRAFLEDWVKVLDEPTPEPRPASTAPLCSPAIAANYLRSPDRLMLRARPHRDFCHLRSSTTQ